MINKFEIIKEPLTDAINLAEAINKFKTPEMEIVFAKLLQKQMNPPMILKEKEG